MTTQIQKVIEQLGYSSNEAKVYLAALSLGEAHVSDIAMKAKLPRTSAQAIVDKLHKDGLMNFYVQRRYKYWVAENPERLLSNLRKREEAVRQALPTLAALRNENRGKRAKKDIGKNAGMLRLLADSCNQPVLIANERVEIEYVNLPWEREFGYTLADVRGMNPRILSSGKTPREVHACMWQALHDGKMFQSDEIVDKRKDGTFFNLLTTIFPVKHSGELFFIQILDDITARKSVDATQKKFLRIAARAM